MASIFSRIIAGEIPCYKIAEDEHHIAFLDINPLVVGHTLVVPKKEVDYIFHLDEQEFASLMQFARKVAQHLDSKIDCSRIGLAVIGLDVPHAHIHLIPITYSDDMNFKREKLKLSHEKFLDTQRRLAF